MAILSLIYEIAPPFSAVTFATCLVWYIISSTTSQLSKLILSKFPYPLFLSSSQFLLGATLSYGLIQLSQKFPKLASTYLPMGTLPASSDPEKQIFSTKILLKILPLGLFQFVGKFFSLSATSLISLATVSSVKALSPLLVVAGYRVIYGVRLPTITYISLLPLLVGVLVIVSAEHPHSNNPSSINEFFDFEYSELKGLVFCFLSTIVFAGQNIYSKQLVTWNTGSPASLLINTESSLQPSSKGIKHLPYSKEDLRLEEKVQEQQHHFKIKQQSGIESASNGAYTNLQDEKLSKMTIVFYISVIGFAFSFCGFLANELSSIFQSFQDHPNSIDSNIEDGTVDTAAEALEVLLLVILDSLSHFLQTLLSFHLLGSIPTLSYSIASLMKRVFLISVSIIVVIGDNKKKNKNSARFFSTQHVYGLVLIAIGLYSYDKWGSIALKKYKN